MGEVHTWLPDNRERTEAMPELRTERKRGGMMKKREELRTWAEFSEEEMQDASMRLQNRLVDWLDAEDIACGSCNGYDLYRALQNALRAEWEKGRTLLIKERDEIREQSGRINA